MVTKVTLHGNQGQVTPPGLLKPSTARHAVVPTRRVALTEALRAQQILKGLYVEKDGKKYALPIDSWEDRTVFLGEKMWNDGNLADAEPLTSPRSTNTVTALMVGIVHEATGYSIEASRECVERAVRAAEAPPLSLNLDPLPYRTGAVAAPGRSHWQQKTLAWLRDNVHQDVPVRYYTATLGHDNHVSTYADLYAKHWHTGWASPFDDGTGNTLQGPLDPDFTTFFATHWRDNRQEQHDHWATCRLGSMCPAIGQTSPASKAALLETMRRQRGFIENLGWLSGAKVTSAFVSEEIDELVSATASEYADFDYHEVGTSSTAESNAHTALQTTSGIARATGTPTDADPIYQSVATITADATETWEEHGIFNNSSGAAMMDRNLTGGQAVVPSDQVQYTYQLTKNPES